MTAALDLPADLADYDFEIECEFCGEPASVMCKGCADYRYKAICPIHLAGVRKFFYDQDEVQCHTCHRPWFYFDTHYDLIPVGGKK